jgi:hypothetical protein
MIVTIAMIMIDVIIVGSVVIMVPNETMRGEFPQPTVL